MERWKEINGWEGKYLISSKGRVKSINGKYKKKFPNGYITIGAIEQIGYRVVSFRRPGELKRFRVHRLVAEYFCDKKDGCDFVNHKDGNKLNNNDWNLEWTTLKGNLYHAREAGLLDLRGEKHPHAKLNESKVIEMRRLYKSGLTQQQVADLFGVCRRQAGDVINGVNWGWLKEGL